MAMLRDRNDVLDLTGIPLSHMDGFQAVADRTRCIIMNRAVGTACTQLIEEGYSSKGFHVKAKSCDWGPMCGFVLDDPNLTKRMPNEKGKQAEALQDAFHHFSAKATPLFISEARRKHLEQTGTITRAAGGGTAIVYWGKQYPKPIPGAARAPVRKMKFVLRKVKGAELRNAPADIMWSVRYFDENQAEHAGNIKDAGAVYAMVNPAGLGGKAGGIRNAMTGDYDLFSLCVRRADYRPGTLQRRGPDARMVGVDQLTQNLIDDVDDPGEDVHLGNMSGRHRQIRDALNNEFRQQRGYVGGNMVHHSDEAGRPFIKDVDEKIFAVVPGEARPYGLPEVIDIREFFMEHTRYGDYVPFFNPGWMGDLVAGKDKGRATLAAIRRGVQLNAAH